MNTERLQKLLALKEEDATDIFLVYAIGIEYIGLNQSADAEKYLRECLAMDEGYIAAYYQLGLVLQLAGKDDEALAYLEKGLGLLKGSSDLKNINEFRSLIQEIKY
ncbi:MAG: hypothetical protein SGJ00_14330 [bacterium]|nr:hypothetical protein [bacterium]